jgi:hypothetical protein
LTAEVGGLAWLPPPGRDQPEVDAVLGKPRGPTGGPWHLEALGDDLSGVLLGTLGLAEPGIAVGGASTATRQPA